MSIRLEEKILDTPCTNANPSINPSPTLVVHDQLAGCWIGVKSSARAGAIRNKLYKTS